MATKITEMEKKVLAAIDASEYGDYLTSTVWTFTVADNCDLAPRSIPGVVSSLVKKGWVVSAGNGNPGDWNADGATVTITKAGAAAYAKAIAPAKPKKEVL